MLALSSGSEVAAGPRPGVPVHVVVPCVIVCVYRVGVCLCAVSVVTVPVSSRLYCGLLELWPVEVADGRACPCAVYCSPVAAVVARSA